MAEYVSKVSDNVLENPFTSTSTALINIVKGMHACKDVEYHLTHIKEIRERALNETCSDDKKKVIVKLRTFPEQSTKCEQTNTKKESKKL